MEYFFKASTFIRLNIEHGIQNFFMNFRLKKPLKLWELNRKNNSLFHYSNRIIPVRKFSKKKQRKNHSDSVQIDKMKEL